MTDRLVARPSGKVIVYDRATGAALERWPVDAQELLATGAYTPDPIPEAPMPIPVEVSPVVEPASVADAPVKSPARKGRA